MTCEAKCPKCGETGFHTYGTATYRKEVYFDSDGNESHRDEADITSEEDEDVLYCDSCDWTGYESDLNLDGDEVMSISIVKSYQRDLDIHDPDAMPTRLLITTQSEKDTDSSDDITDLCEIKTDFGLENKHVVCCVCKEELDDCDCVMTPYDENGGYDTDVTILQHHDPLSLPGATWEAPDARQPYIQLPYIDGRLVVRHPDERIIIVKEGILQRPVYEQVTDENKSVLTYAAIDGFKMLGYQIINTKHRNFTVQANRDLARYADWLNDEIWEFQLRDSDDCVEDAYGPVACSTLELSGALDYFDSDHHDSLRAAWDGRVPF